MADSSDIFVRFGADIEPLKKGTKQAGSALKKFGKQARASANTMGKVAAGASLAGAAIGAKLVSNSLAAVDAQAKLARQLGTSVASMATLERAADMSGISLASIEAGAKNLEVAMGEAAQGTGIAKDTLEALNITAKDMQGLSLDEKILKVNKAIKENIPATEQAAAAADLFGKKAGFAIRELSPETLTEARKEVEGFGVALSDVDAAKIERANDAMATIGLAVDGVSNQFTAQLAPILEAIAGDFKNAAMETGGFKEEGTAAIDAVASAVGFLGDAFRGVEVAIKALEIGFDTLKTGALGIGAFFSDAMQEAMDASAAEMATSIDEMNALMMAPIPSELIEARLESIREKDALEVELAQNKVDKIAAIDDSAKLDQLRKEEEFAKAQLKIKKATDDANRAGAAQALSDVAMLTQSGNKKLFEIGKVAARASVVMNTHEAAMNAYKWGSTWGGPAGGAAMAATAIAAGGVRLAAVNATSFGGGGLSGSGSGAATPAGAATNGAAAAAQSAPQNKSVRIEGIDPDKNFSGGQVQQLAEQLVELQNDGFQLVI